MVSRVCDLNFGVGVVTMARLGPGGRGSTRPGVSFRARGDGLVLVRGCGRAVIRSHAATMSSAQGQVAGILSRRRRPPRTQLVARPGRQLIQAGDQPMAGPGAVASDHQPAAQLDDERRRRKQVQCRRHCLLVGALNQR